MWLENRIMLICISMSIHTYFMSGKCSGNEKKYIRVDEKGEILLCLLFTTLRHE